MSVFLSTVQAVVTVSPSVSPVVSATVVPVAHAASTGFVAQLNSYASSFSTADLLVAAGAIATGLQYLINKFANVRKFTNQMLGLVLPFLVIAPSVIATSSKNAAYGAIVYCVAQVLYYTIEKIKDTAATPEPVLPAGV